jgi:hypothetical protein
LAAVGEPATELIRPPDSRYIAPMIRRTAGSERSPTASQWSEPHSPLRAWLSSVSSVIFGVVVPEFAMGGSLAGLDDDELAHHAPVLVLEDVAVEHVGD